jgi:hypothetical protein
MSTSKDEADEEALERLRKGEIDVEDVVKNLEKWYKGKKSKKN